MTIIVEKPGLLTTLQDNGRFGFQQYGVIVSGAMDSFAHTIANLLVGNEEAEASLEMTVMGASLYFQASAVIAICGADMIPTADGCPVPMWRPVYIQQGTTLQFGASREGTRCYLAVSGGFDVPMLMNSYSTYLRAGIGGFEGRGLKAGDCLELKPATALGSKLRTYLLSQVSETTFSQASWHVSYTMLPNYNRNPVVRVIPGAQAQLFKEESLVELFTTSFRVQPQSDRMGYRLEGKPLQLLENQELLSEPVTFGTVQVPSDGNPIVLMADRQTTGGYPKIAQVITADLPLMAQVQVGSHIHFQQIELQEAEEINLYLKYNIHLLRTSINLILR